MDRLNFVDAFFVFIAVLFIVLDYAGYTGSS